jgi:hypothetical protein
MLSHEVLAEFRRRERSRVEHNNRPHERFFGLLNYHLPLARQKQLLATVETLPCERLFGSKERPHNVSIVAEPKRSALHKR